MASAPGPSLWATLMPSGNEVAAATSVAIRVMMAIVDGATVVCAGTSLAFCRSKWVKPAAARTSASPTA